jgi:predicted RNA-binding protein YlqC (UPF0109 family)
METNLPETSMKDFIECLIKQLVDNPEKVQVKEVIGHSVVILELRVGDGEIGKVIGKHGQTAKSLRTLLSAASAKQGKRSVLEILEPNGIKGVKQ